MERYIVNEHGEVLQTINPNDNVMIVNPGDKVVRKKSVEYFENTEELKKRFIKVNDQATYVLSKYGKHICLLLRFVGYMDGVLKFSNGIFLTTKNISKIFGINERNTTKILDELTKEDVIHKHKMKNKNYYTFNPWIASRGKRISSDLYNEFKMTEWALNSQDPSEYETIIGDD